ncbi:MAG TPA: ATP-binding protein [Gemmatimonadaceae bacterium]|nr:ATP-binding protein [Gemmatimonadaceae bacterium]
MIGEPSSLPEELRRGLGGPIRWRLLLALVVVGGFALLHRIDALLQRDYGREAQAQAVQADALIEGAVWQRAQLLTTLAALIASAHGSRDEVERFDVLAREIRREMPDIATVYLLDARGAVRQARGEDAVPGGTLTHRAFPLRAPAMRQAAEQRGVAATAPLTLADGRPGTLMYVPILEGERLTGYVAGAFAYERLFTRALAGQLRGRFAWRVLDERGDVIATSAGYPTRIARDIQRPLALPGGHGWTLHVAVESMQPIIARTLNWTTGAIVLVLVVFLALREEFRARRFAAYSHDLELLSRDLLDANMRLEERSQQIAEANRAKSRFLANVSHELRTPLNAIVGYNALALDGMYGELPQPLRASHQRVQAAADHLLSLVNDVLDLSKIEVGRMDLEIEVVDLGSVLDGVATVVEPAAEAKGLRVDVVVARDLPKIATDPRHLRQILLNLVANAIKFTERGSVTVVAKRDGDQVAISVEDTGIGIASTDLERIFEEFEQVRPSGRGDSMQRGTGLGLAIARKMARLLGGDVSVASQLGRGSCFTLLLPSARRQTPPSGVPDFDSPEGDPDREGAVHVAAAVGTSRSSTPGAAMPDGQHASARGGAADEPNSAPRPDEPHGEPGARG